MPTHDIIVVGASAGGVEALSQLVATFPSDFPAAVFIVLHIPAQATSVLPQILGRVGPLPAAHAVDGVRIQQGNIYIAPPDHHLIVEQGRVRVAYGPAENRHRPAVDPLFRSAALAYGPRVVGVILSGTLDDGSAGMMSVKAHSGIAVVQDPAEALYDGMPLNVMKYVDVDYCLPVAKIGAVLRELAAEPVVGGEKMPDDKDGEYEVEAAELSTYALVGDERPGVPSVYACPDCHGTLWEIDDGNIRRYRCRVGHAYTEESLLAAHSESLERALWAALRALEENASILRRTAERARETGMDAAASRFEERCREMQLHAESIRQVLLNSLNGERPIDRAGNAA
ncbi:MAG: chemotaxis protein CheB [Anaerolineae bacterium]